jgi:hypothetical protein
MSTAEDLANLRRVANELGAGPLKDVFEEVVAVIPMVASWTPVATSGSAVCRYTNNGHAYDVRYQIGNVGNLVHELTHIVVNEAYGTDFINYPCPHGAKVPDREFSPKGYCKNEEDRQFKQMSVARNQRNTAKLTELTKWAEASQELKPQQRTDIVTKLNYGIQWPAKEYDTVINQTLVWLYEWNYPLEIKKGKKPVVNALYEELEKAVKAAHEEREREAPRTLLKGAMARPMAQRRAAMGYDD